MQFPAAPLAPDELATNGTDKVDPESDNKQ